MFLTRAEAINLPPLPLSLSPSWAAYAARALYTPDAMLMPTALPRMVEKVTLKGAPM